MTPYKKLAMLGLAAALMQGCDAGSSPDNQARAKMDAGHVAAAKGDEAGVTAAKQILSGAASVPGISDATAAQAHAALGEVQYNSGLEQLRDADRKELNASRIALQIAALGSQLGNSATLVQGYQKLDPKAAMAAIDDKITQTKGSPDKPAWQATDQLKVNVSSVSAADAEVSRIQGEIAKRQAQVNDLDQQRVAALKEADDSQKASDAAKGQESVDLFKKYSDAKKKAADVQSQIDVINGQLMPLQNDLEVAVGQQQIMQGAVTALQDQSKSLDDGWKEIQSKIAAQTDLIAQIASAPAPASTQPSETPSAAGLSITAKATILAQMVKDADDARSRAADSIQAAIGEFDKAVTSANQAGTEMSELASDRPALESVVKIAHEVISVQAYKLRQATAERVLGELQMSKAAGLSARIKLRELLTPLMAAANQPLPKEIADPSLDGGFKDALTAASESFDAAANHLEDVLGSAGSDPLTTTTKKAAAISKIFLLNSQQQLAMLKGDKAGADKAHAAAVDAVKAAADLQVTFPNLPGDLAAAIPPPPAPATEPTSAPTTEGATAEADSPDVQAIRTMLQTFIDALAKGDMDGAKALAQIEPGQEEYFNQFAAFLTQSLQLVDAIKEKFPDQAGATPSLDVAAQLKAMKVDIKGDEGYSSQMPGQPEKKMFVKVGDQWKLYVGAPTPAEQMAMGIMQKMGAAMPAITQDIKAGKYATMQDVQKALMQAMAPGAAAPTTAPAPQ
jgi:hypothetical protein